MSEATARDQQWFGHPRGLSTLFFTELWERFSYYGMRTLLILFMTDSAYNGLGMGADTAGAIYGLYTFGVYALALPGGLSVAKQISCDLIVMASHRPGAKDFLLGPNAARVVRHANCSVTVVRD